MDTHLTPTTPRALEERLFAYIPSYILDGDLLGLNLNYTDKINLNYTFLNNFVLSSYKFVCTKLIFFLFFVFGSDGPRRSKGSRATPRYNKGTLADALRIIVPPLRGLGGFRMSS